MRQNKGEKQRYTLFTAKALFILILPICVESALNMSLGLVDSFMVKNIGSNGNGMSAVSNVDQISSLVIQLLTAFSAGGAVIASQLLGANKVEEANRSAKQLVVFMLLASVVVSAPCLILNHQIVNLFFGGKNDNAEYLGYAYTYFYIMAASFPFLALSSSCAVLFRAQRRSINTMVASVIGFLVNVGSNALLIYVFELEILGAALATLLARAIPAVVMLIQLGSKKNLICVKLFKRFRFEKNTLGKIVGFAVPNGIENSLFQLGKVLVVSFVTIGIYWENGVNIHNAANTVAQNINALSSIVGNGINIAILTVVGQAVGTGSADCVKYYIKKMIAISLVGNAVCVGLTMGFSPLLVGVFGDNISPETAKIAQNCLWLCLSFQFITYVPSFAFPAVLKANSDMRYVMFSAVASMILMRVGLCYILTCEWAGFRLGAYGLWIGMVADWILRGVLFGARLLSGKWKKSSGMLESENAPAEKEAEENAA